MSDDIESDFRAFRPVRIQARRLITLGVKAGKPWDQATTVRAVSRAAKTTAKEVVRLISECGYLMQVDAIEGVPMDDWIVWEDGE
jgi:hypothetical protein